jgi:acyl-CoA thioester hydrolase
MTVRDVMNIRRQLVNNSRPTRWPCAKRSSNGGRKKRTTLQLPCLQTISTRWMDNDIYGHVNKAQFHSYFETAVNRRVTEHGVLDIHGGPAIGLVVQTSCSYFRPIIFPEIVYAGIRVAKLGTSRVPYEVDLFRNDDAEVSAAGYFIDVYVDRATNRPTPLSAPCGRPFHLSSFLHTPRELGSRRFQMAVSILLREQVVDMHPGTVRHPG